LVSKTVTKYTGLKHVTTTSTSILLLKDTKYMTKHVLTDTALISKLKFYARQGNGGQPSTVKGLIYSDVAGVPTALIATTAETTINSNTAQLWDLTFTGAVSLPAGTYWFGVFFDTADDGAYSYYETGTTNQWATNSDDYTDGPSDPFGAPSYLARQLCLFAEYTTNVNMVFPPSLIGRTVVTPIARTQAIRWQEKSFWAAGRFWVFYINYVGSGNYRSYFTSSADNVTWETPVFLRQMAEYNGECLQAILEGDYVHVFARCFDWNPNPVSIFYRRGLLNSDGTITWTADWAQAWNDPGTVNVDFYACLDSSGYPHITWGFGIENCTTYIIKSSRNDGVWETAGGYPVQLDLDPTGKYHTNNFVVPLSNDKLYAFYFEAPQSIDAGTPIYGRLWNGASWMAEETCTTSSVIQQYATGHESWSRGVTADGDDNIHLVFLQHRQKAGSINPFSWNVIYVKRTYGVGWGAETTLEADVLAKNASPSVAIVGSNLKFFWTGSPSPNVIFGKILDEDGFWHKTTYLIEELTDGIPNTTSPNNYGYDGIINSFPKTYNDRLGILYIKNTHEAATYDINLAIESYSGEYWKTNISDYQALVHAFKNVKGAPGFGVIRHALTLGSRDSMTGWYAKTFTESDIEMVILTKGSRQLALQLGYYVSLDALGFTVNYVREGDQIEDSISRFWEVKAVQPITIGDSLRFYLCDLKELPLHG